MSYIYDRNVRHNALCQLVYFTSSQYVALSIWLCLMRCRRFLDFEVSFSCCSIAERFSGFILGIFGLLWFFVLFIGGRQGTSGGFCLFV